MSTGRRTAGGGWSEDRRLDHQVALREAGGAQRAQVEAGAAAEGEQLGDGPAGGRGVHHPVAAEAGALHEPGSLRRLADDRVVVGRLRVQPCPALPRVDRQLLEEREAVADPLPQRLQEAGVEAGLPGRRVVRVGPGDQEAAADLPPHQHAGVEVDGHRDRLRRTGATGSSTASSEATLAASGPPALTTKRARSERPAAETSKPWPSSRWMALTSTPVTISAPSLRASSRIAETTPCGSRKPSLAWKVPARSPSGRTNGARPSTSSGASQRVSTPRERCSAHASARERSPSSVPVISR